MQEEELKRSLSLVLSFCPKERKKRREREKEQGGKKWREGIGEDGKRGRGSPCNLGVF